MRAVAVVSALVSVLALADASATGAEQSTVTARSTAGAGQSVPCPAVVRAGAFGARGGCVIRALSARTDVYVLSAVGRIPFGRCKSHFTLHVDAHGRAILDGFEIDGPSPCRDADACYRGRHASDEYPWRARLAATGGRQTLDVRVCLDTCMGRFAGIVRLRLVTPADGRWRAVAAAAPVGTSGWNFDGSWTLTQGPRFSERGRQGPVRMSIGATPPRSPASRSASTPGR